MLRRPAPIRSVLLILAVAWGVLSLLTYQRSPAAELYWPEDDRWETVSPGEAGMDATQLDAALNFAGARRSKGVVVARNGRLVAERYWAGWNASSTSDMCSAQKSLSSVLIGIALDEGSIRNLDQSASAFLTEWKGTAREAISLRHLVSMTSGLHCSRRSDLWEGLRAADQTVHALGLALDYPPGTHWDYNNPAYGLVNTILERATGKTRDRYAREKLYAPLGMKNTQCEWIFLAPRLGLKHHATRSSCRDMARFGLLVLRGGRWQDRQIVSESFIREATRPSQQLNPGYGYLFWLNGSRQHLLPYEGKRREGMLFPGCSPDTVAALGAKDSKIYIVPSLDLVVTRLGERATESPGVAPTEFDAPFLKMVCQSFRPFRG